MLAENRRVLLESHVLSVEGERVLQHAGAAQPGLSQWQLLPFYISILSGPMGGGILPVLFVTLMGAFDVDRATLSLAVPAYMFPFAAVQLFSGGISDLTSRRASILFGFGSFGLASMLTGLSPNFHVFLVMQMIQGATNAFTTPLVMATLGDLMPGRHTGRTMGFFSTATLVGQMMAPLTGGYLGDISWRAAYIFVGLFTWVITAWYVAWFRRHGRSIPKRPRTQSLRADIRAIIRAMGFSIVLLCSLSFLASVAMRGPIFLYADYLKESFASGVQTAGLVLATFGLAGLLFGPFAGDLIGRIGLYRAITVSILGAGATLLLMTQATSPLYFAVANFLMGICGIFAWTGLNVLAVRMVPEHRGTASSLFGGAQFFAAGVSPLWYTPLYQSIGPRSIFVAAAISAVVLLAPLAALHGRSARLTGTAPQSALD
jgi:MFS family permease